ncbi:MAG: PQQ-dependent sugar dehydrogenase, partial [Chitinophagaceae bacterium]|nr:PQQ-dependent sugar dehydrogenase [Chitinophagaceae bacterium]
MRIIFSAILLIHCTGVLAGEYSDSLKGKNIQYNTPPSINVAKGFSITPVVEKLGRNRHITIGPNGDLFVKLERLRNGFGIFQFKARPNGQYEVVDSFGNYTGTGILVKNGFLYASSDDAVFRYRLDKNGRVENRESPQRLVYGLWSRRQHASKSLALDNSGNLYVNIGAPSNACQERDRTKDSPGMDPCPILDSAGGIWKFRADVSDQSYAQGQRYATGLRNVVGLDWNDSENALYVMMHGRDMLSSLYPGMFSDSLSAELPGEEMFR